VLRTSGSTTPAQSARIFEALRSALLAMVWESHALGESNRVGLQEYLVMCRHRVFADVVVALVEPAAGIELPEQQRYAPAVRSLNTAVCNVIAWYNDLRSFSWERRSAVHLSLPVLIAERRTCDLESAFAAVAFVCDQEAQRIHGITTELARSAVPVVRDYARAMEWVVAATDWHRTNRRYD
jgi:hypothetical protein